MDLLSDKINKLLLSEEIEQDVSIQTGNVHEYTFSSYVVYRCYEEPEENRRFSDENEDENKYFSGHGPEVEKLVDAPFSYGPAMNDMVSDFNETGLLQYMDEGSLKKAITSMTAGSDGVEFVVRIKTNRELTPEELEQVKDYLTGQYSDGWGEGYEQQEKHYEGYTVCISPWASKDWWMQVQKVKPTDAMNEEELKEELERITGTKVIYEELIRDDKDKIKYINDIRSRAAAAGKEEEFKKVCKDNPCKLTGKSIDSTYKKAEKFEKEELDAKKGIPEKAQQLKTKKENTMNNKGTIKEADDKRIDRAFQTLISAKKALEEGETQLIMNLGFQFQKIWNDDLTTITNHIKEATESLNMLAKKIREQLKQ